jgi:hypothetical protein
LGDVVEPGERRRIVRLQTRDQLVRQARLQANQGILVAGEGLELGDEGGIRLQAS